MTDKPSDEPSGDARFERWFAEQDPFGNAKTKQPTKEAETLNQQPVPVSGLFRFGIALPAAILILGTLALGFAAGVILKGFH
jgi:hypothetical protein